MPRDRESGTLNWGPRCHSLRGPAGGARVPQVKGRALSLLSPLGLPQHLSSPGPAGGLSGCHVSAELCVLIGCRADGLALPPQVLRCFRGREPVPRAPLLSWDAWVPPEVPR